MIEGVRWTETTEDEELFNAEFFKHPQFALPSPYKNGVVVQEDFSDVTRT